MAVLTGAGLLALAAPADAEAAPSNCAGRKVRTLTFSTGAVHLYKGSGYVCAITLPDHPGTRRPMIAQPATAWSPKAAISMVT